MQTEITRQPVNGCNVFLFGASDIVLLFIQIKVISFYFKSELST